MRKTTSILVGCVLSASILATTTSRADDDLVTYQITITNVTPGQPFAPIMAASHKSGMSFFEVGHAPSDELARLAESGNGKPLAAKLMATPGVSDAQVSTTGLTFPGKTTTMTIMAKSGMDRISIGSMLGVTNDAFFAVRDVALPKGRQVLSYSADAYDAGSEDNDELAATIGAIGGQGYSPDNFGEGFVHIHNGVHGIGALPANIRDWRNPVAEIVIERMK